MDPNKMRPSSAAPNVKTSVWKTPEQRNIMVKKVADFLMKEGPPSWGLDIPGLMKSVERFEEKVFTSAKDEAEYIAMISAKMKAVRPSLQSDEFHHSSSNIAGSGVQREADPEWQEQTGGVLESNAQQPKTPEIEKYEHHKRLLEYIFAIFQVNKSHITLDFKQRLDRVEKYIHTIDRPKNASEKIQTGEPNSVHLQDHQAANQFNSSQPQPNQVATISDDSSTAMQHLIKALTSISNEALMASCGDIGMVVHMNDGRSTLEPLNEPANSAIDTDLERVIVTDTQARYLTRDNFVTRGRKMNRFLNSMPAGDSSIHLNKAEKPQSNPVTTQENHTLSEEIKELNNQMIDTEVVVDKEKSFFPGVVEGNIQQNEGLTVKLIFNSVTVNLNPKSKHCFNKKDIIKPLSLHIPRSYPKCSPIILDDMPSEISNDLENLSMKAKIKLQLSLRSLDQPLSLTDIAKLWERCAREVICGYAHLHGGGTFTSKYGGWESCGDDS
ncbi:hypothetical protein VNO77_25939 [Canavalia gladiata]|uniref:Mediator complex subunit 15 KIX domain-containing protein n=1 Tax=Canavalia gladiata TaxID=3824 RepID=A0AAN9KV63_CANGL